MYRIPFLYKLHCIAFSQGSFLEITEYLFPKAFFQIYAENKMEPHFLRKVLERSCLRGRNYFQGTWIGRKTGLF